MFSLTFRCFCILKTLLLIDAFFHENSRKIFTKPNNLKDDSLYGFSIAYQPESSSLLVSAPQASHRGQVYHIDVNTGKATQEDAAYFKTQLGGDAQNYSYWLGATVAAGPHFSVTCAPRYVEMVFVKKKSGMSSKRNVKNAKTPGALSLCFIKQKNWKILKYITFADRYINTTEFRERMDSFGWSILVAPNQKDVLIGGAAMHTGRVSLYTNAAEEGSVPKLINQISGDNPVRYNFGYSLASGNFFSDETVYAISTTFGDRGYGKVYFFNTKRENIGAIVDEDSVGSMFGAALCSAKFRVPTLLVGAPTYSDNAYSHNVGAVYIYTAASVGTNRMTKKRVLKGTTSGGFFGHSIVNLGDLDDDDNDEIAIAAPYEDDGKGAVYIFSSVGILEGKIRKKIQPEGMYSFGFSLAVLHNENESNGLAVSAIGTNSVVVYKSLASITVDLHGSVTINKTDATKNITEVEIKSCAHVEYPKKPVEVKTDLQITVKITDQLCKLDAGRDKYVYDEKIRGRHSPLCHKNIKATCLNNEYSRLIISYEITATNENTMIYDNYTVLLSERSKLSYSGHKYSTCEGKICKPVLTLNINSTIPNRKPYYIVGSSTSELISVSVSNSGDTAYGACVELSVRGALVTWYPPDCTMPAGTDRIICKDKHYIRKAEEWVIGNITLEPRENIKSTEEYYVEVLYNDCSEQDQGDLKLIERYYLSGDTGKVVITGQTNPEGDVDVTPDDLRTEGKSFEHLYFIENKGITDWNGVQVKITLPSVPYIGYSEVPIKVDTGFSYFGCSIDNTMQINNTTVVSCNIGDLPKSQKTSLAISMEIIPNMLELDENKPNITVTTILEVEGINISLTEKSLVKLKVASVPVWVIATASVIGLLLFALLAFVLYEFGFLKRKNKDKLVELKREVYRQSVRRSAIRESMRATARRKSTEDIQFLMDDAGHGQARERTIDEKLQSHK